MREHSAPYRPHGIPREQQPASTRKPGQKRCRWSQAILNQRTCHTIPRHLHLFGRCFGVPRKHTARHIDHMESHASHIQPARENPARNDACTAEPSLIKVDDCTSESMKPPPFAAARAPLLFERACSEHAVSAGRARHASMCRAVDHAPGRTARRRRSGLRVTLVSLFTPQNGTLSHQVEGGY